MTGVSLCGATEAVDRQPVERRSLSGSCLISDLRSGALGVVLRVRGKCAAGVGRAKDKKRPSPTDGASMAPIERLVLNHTRNANQTLHHAGPIKRCELRSIPPTIAAASCLPVSIPRPPPSPSSSFLVKPNQSRVR